MHDTNLSCGLQVSAKVIKHNVFLYIAPDLGFIKKCHITFSSNLQFQVIRLVKIRVEEGFEILYETRP